VGAPPEDALIEPEFAGIFNRAWSEFAEMAPLKVALLGVAAYEILDEPDYSTLYAALSLPGRKMDLTFFRIHAEASHFELFRDLLRRDPGGEGELRNDLELASQFVLNTQRFMWMGLLDHLQC
jgi:hypothetical protein